MFAGGWGVSEDPATGSAVAAFAGALMAFEPPGGGEHMMAIEQGFEMGRPSKISLGMKVEGGKLVDATIGGYARIVCDGTIDV
jgi:trans-2,3-dihydro-3-hydroxyanthranilate isomerase